jgi:hypothetical protein
MNLKTTAIAVLAIGASFAYAGAALAQACPGTLTGAVPVAGGTVSGNNCNNNTNFTKICANSETLGGGGMDIWSMPIGTNYSGVNIAINTSAFVAELGVIGAPCSSSTTCIIDVSNVGPAPGSVSSAFPAAQPAGTYYIFVANVADATCGAYNLVVSGTLPVKLQKFSVN